MFERHGFTVLTAEDSDAIAIQGIIPEKEEEALLEVEEPGPGEEPEEEPEDIEPVEETIVEL